MIVLSVLLLFTTTWANPINKRFHIENKTLEVLDEWELRLLRDFVRGRGHGSVSRLSIDQLMASTDPPFSVAPEETVLDFNDPNMISLGGAGPDEGSQFIIPGPIITPASHHPPMQKPSIRIKPSVVHEVRPMVPQRKPTLRKVENPKPSEEEPDFRELAGLFQKFIDRRKSMPKKKKPKPVALQPLPVKYEPLRKSPKSTSAMGRWEVMDPDDLSPPASSENPEDWEQKMKLLSQQLNTILQQIKESPSTSTTTTTTTVPRRPQPVVSVLRNGSAEQSSEGLYIFIATITLIQDEGLNILVDTGLGTDSNGRAKLIDNLSSYGLSPSDVDIVVTTHGHPDHVGGIDMFPQAHHYQSWYHHYGTHFNLSALFENEPQYLTSNVYLMRSQGHTSEDISVFVNNEKTRGTVVVAGDTFIRPEDVDYPMMWQPLSADETKQMESRRKIVCSGAEWIVPGHGAMFRIDRNMRNKFQCR